MKIQNRKKIASDAEIERLVKDNAGISVYTLSKLLKVNAVSLEARLYGVVNVYCNDQGLLFYHDWSRHDA